MPIPLKFFSVLIPFGFLVGGASLRADPPKFNGNTATLTVGRDGKVYLTSLSPANAGIILRLNRDGSGQTRCEVGGLVLNATANVDGRMAAAVAHFARNVSLYDASFNLVGRMTKLSGDGGFSSPAHVEAGPGGDFYAADQYRDRIVRFDPDGLRTGNYLIPREPPGASGEIRDFRVCEKTRALYVLTQGPPAVIRCFSFDRRGWKVTCRKLWKIEAPISWAEPHLGGGGGGFDVDEDGILYVTDRLGETIQRFGPDGKRLPSLTLHLGTRKPAPAERGFHTLRVCNREVLLKRMHATELFQRYDLDRGGCKNVVEAGEFRVVRSPGLASAVQKAGAGAGEGRSLRVLFVGNSQTSCVCDLPEMVEDLSQSAPPGRPRIRADAVTLGGNGLEGLWKDGLARKKIKEGKYDWVVLQEMIGVAEGNKANFAEYARKFDAAIKEGGARTLLFVTGHVQSSRSHHLPMYRANLEMARERKCRIAGAGVAWLKAWERRPNLDLHFTDRAHPNRQGYYLNACVVFAALTDTNPAGLDPCGLDCKDAEFFQAIAWKQYAEDRAAEAE